VAAKSQSKGILYRLWQSVAQLKIKGESYTLFIFFHFVATGDQF